MKTLLATQLVQISIQIVIGLDCSYKIHRGVVLLSNTSIGVVVLSNTSIYNNNGNSNYVYTVDIHGLDVLQNISFIH